MIKKKLRVLGIIPARGGSKGLPMKNIRPLKGIPLICYSIRAAEASCLTDTIVSTDSKEIAAIARSCGGNIPFLRPEQLAQDKTSTMAVVLHVLENIEDKFDAVMVLQPTSPLRSSKDIDIAVEMLTKDPGADSVISVVKVEDKHPARMKELKNGVLVDPPFAEEIEGQRRQDLPEYYLRNGAIYLTKIDVLRRKRSFKGEKCLGYVMPEKRSVNIDGEIDFLVAEAFLSTE